MSMTEDQDIRQILKDLRSQEGWLILTPYRKNLLDMYVSGLEQDLGRPHPANPSPLEGHPLVRQDQDLGFGG